MKSSGATAGVVLATGATPPPQEKKEDKIRVGMIGTGGRGNYLLGEGIWQSDDLEIVAVADVYKPHQKGGSLQGWLANAQISLTRGRPTPEQREKLRSVIRPACYYDFREMLATETLDTVIIATPPHTHHEIVLACLDAGKHVFVETPLATTIDDGRAIVEKAHEAGRIVQVGHQRRYHPNYNLAMKRFREEGVLGRLSEIMCRKSQILSGRRSLPKGYEFNDLERKFIATDLEHHLNWRLYTDPSGGPSLDQLPQSMDVANWFTGGIPAKVYATGGVDYWRDGRSSPDNMSALFEYQLAPRQAPSRGDLTVESDAPAPYTLRCSYSLNLTNTDLGRFERLSGTHASLKLDVQGDCLLEHEIVRSGFRGRDTKQHKGETLNKYEKTRGPLSDAERRELVATGGSSNPYALIPTAPLNADGSEESPEVHQFRAFADHIRNGGTPRANAMVGLAAVIAGASARKSYETGNPVDIDPAWMEFEFDTPSITDYDPDTTAIEAEV